ncbi:MAG: GGDEF domain-containing protein [Clostridia bacterium]|nr:GGDEF domain-containing protein [Clostridia bacterium]
MEFDVRKIKPSQIILLTLGVVIALTALIVVTIKNVQAEAVNNCYDQLSEASISLGDSIEDRIAGDTTILSILAKIIATRDLEDPEEMSQILNSYDYTGSLISHMEILYPDDHLLVSDGTILDASGKMDFAAEEKKGVHLTGKMAGIRNPEDYVLRNFVPIQVNGDTVAMLIGSVSLSELPEKYKVHSYGGKASLYIMDTDTGDFLLDTWHKSLGNVHDMNKRKMVIGESMDACLLDMKKGNGGNMAFVSETTGEILYLHYEPLEVNNWSIMVAVPHSLAFSSADEITSPLYVMAIIEGIILFIYLGSIIGYIWHNYTEKNRQLRQIRYMFTIEKLLFNSHQYVEYVSEALGEVASVLDSERAFLLIIKHDEIVEVHQQSDATDSELAIKEKLIGKDYHTILPSDWQTMDNKPCIVLNQVDPAIQRLDDTITRCMMIPVFDGNQQVMGILGVTNSRKNYSSAEFLQCVALSFASAVNAIDFYRTIHRMGTEDSLTGLKNRNAYETFMSTHQGHLMKNVACIYVDLNGLHQVNNEHGHESGDRLLCTVADAMLEVFSYQNAYRIGGDEYVAILSDISKSDAYIKVSKLTENVTTHDASISVGIVWQANVKDLNKLAIEADQEMLKKKREYYNKKEINRRKR